jgi:uncharacterized membrane protein YjfL (UPF0719 family)
VRRDPFYLTFYVLLGSGWLGMGAWLFPFVGLSPRDDALERGNAAAALAVAGALGGATLCYAGGNIGDGPGVEAVLFSVLLSTAAFFMLWFVVEMLTREPLSEEITVERSPAAGLRLAGWLLGLGFALGWSVAGDWTSADATLRDFVRSLPPALALASLGWVVENVGKPALRGSFSQVSVSGFIGLLYLAGPIAWIAVTQQP